MIGQNAAFSGHQLLAAGWWRVGRHGVNRAAAPLTAAPLCSSPARRGVVEPSHGRLMGCATFVASMRHRSIDRPWAGRA